MCYHNTVKRTLCGLHQKVKERWGEAGLTPNGPGWRQGDGRALPPGPQALFIDREANRHLSGFRMTREFPTWTWKNFYTVPNHSFFFFLKPKLERKQAYSGHNVARKETQKSRHFIRKALTGSEPTWPRIWGSFVWGGKQAAKPRGLGERQSQVDVPDVSHAAGVQGEDVGEYFSRLTECCLEVQLISNCPE